MDYRARAKEMEEAYSELSQLRSATDQLRPLLAITDLNELKARLSVAIEAIEQGELGMRSISMIVAQMKATIFNATADIVDSVPSSAMQKRRTINEDRDRRAAVSQKLRNAHTAGAVSGDWSQLDSTVKEYYDDHGLGREGSGGSGQGSEGGPAAGSPSENGID